jgi:cyclophilin family peptidyl-prolyl cis-trans isomerase
MSADPGVALTGGEPTAPGAVLAGAAVRPGSRSANRAVKRATSPRPKARPGNRNRNSNTGLIVLAVAAVAIGAAVLLIGNPFGKPTPSASPSAAPVLGDGTCPTSQPAALAATDKRTVTIETAKGTIVMSIDGARAPIATGNFVALATCHFYDGITFHRLVPGFVIQGGDPDGDGGGGPGYTIKDDPLIGTYHRGTVAMARTGDPDSQGSQFFIVLSDDANAPLTDPQNAPYPYAIMGEVISGMEVVDAIAAMPNEGSPGNAAVDPVVMTKVTVSAGTSPSTAPTTAPSTTAPATPGATPAPSVTTAP